MDAPTKRPCEDKAVENGHLSSKISSISKDENNLESFLKWSSDNELWLSPKVYVSRQGSCAQYGMITKCQVSQGDCLFKIPRNLLLHPGTSAISRLLKKEAGALVSDSGWVPLLLSLMFEYNNPTSVWRAYLDLVPDFKVLDLPMFWPESERASLLGSANGVENAVTRDLKSLTAEFTEIVQPFVQKHKDVFGSVCESLDLYKKMVAFVMAYSFTEPSDEEEEDAAKKAAPMMVPMADILNHIAHNNAELRFEKNFLKMVATVDIEQDREVFNTYGTLSNKDELHMYGFAERFPNNDKDTVDIPAILLKEEAKSLDIHKDDADMLSDKWMLLLEQGAVDEEDGIVLGVNAVETSVELEAALKVLVMTRAEFDDHVEKDGWSETESEDEEDRDDHWSFGENGICKLKATWKGLLKGCAERCLARYSTTLAEDEERLSSGLPNMSPRQTYVLYTDHGQKTILHKLLYSCS